MEPALVEDARTLFETAEVTRVVCVDDQAAKIGDVDRAAVAAAIRDGAISVGEVRRMLEGLNEGADFEGETLGDLADRVRDEHDLTLSAEIVSLGIDGSESADPETLTALRAFAVEAGAEFEAVDLAEWKRRKTEFCTAGTLVLFDRDMSGNAGGGEDTGVQLLLDALEMSPVRAGLFTHSVALGEEYKAWKELAAANADMSDRILVISKSALHHDNYPSFLSGLRVLLVAPAIAAIIDRVRDLQEDVAREALDDLASLSPYTLDRMFVGSVEDEGEWGPENFHTYSDAIQRRKLRRLLHEDVEINRSISMLRSLASMTSRMEPPSPAEFRTAQRTRRVDDHEHINLVRLPIDNGDIFKVHAPSHAPKESAFWSGDLYILLLQRCDVTLRAGDQKPGTRNYDPKFLPLYRVARVSRGREPLRDTSLRYPVSYLTPDSDQEHEVVFGERIMVPAIALDLCAFNTDGRSTLSLQSGLTSPTEGLSLASHEAARRYLEKLREMLKAYSASALETGQGPLLRLVTAGLSGASKDWSGLNASFNKVEERVTYGITRVGRLLDPDAQDALDRLTAVQGRVALHSALQIE